MHVYVLHMVSISHQNKLDSAIILVCIANEKIANKFQEIEYYILSAMIFFQVSPVSVCLLENSNCAIGLLLEGIDRRQIYHAVV